MRNEYDANRALAGTAASDVQKLVWHAKRAPSKQQPKQRRSWLQRMFKH